MKNKLIVVISLVALALAGFVVYSTLGRSDDALVGATPGSLLIEQYSPYVMQNGGISSALPIQTTSTVTAANEAIGTSGTNLSFIGVGSCTLGLLGPSSIDALHAATTTKVYDCPFTGIQSGDIVIASIATSTVDGAAGWTVQSAKASTTNGYAEIGIYNATGASFVPSTRSVGSSTKVTIFRAN